MGLLVVDCVVSTHNSHACLSIMTKYVFVYKARHRFLDLQPLVRTTDSGLIRTSSACQEFRKSRSICQFTTYSAACTVLHIRIANISEGHHVAAELQR